MNCAEFRQQLDAYLDDALSSDERQQLEGHAVDCPQCDRALKLARDLRDRATTMPETIAPQRDLWPEIQAQLRPSGRTRRATLVRWAIPLTAAAALMVVAALLSWPRNERPAPAWTVSALAGAPRVDAETFTGQRNWRVGQWLETDADSQAQLAIGSIGEVRLDPNSRVRLLGAAGADHRVELMHGTIHALVWAPPRLFFVETPSATAIDLGCAYTLSVEDDGAGLLEVSSGYVALEHEKLRAIVPAGMLCRLQPGRGPGTPFSATATPQFREALERFDAAEGSMQELEQIVARAGAADVVTLWHLLSRVPVALRGVVFDRLASLVPPRPQVTRESILANNQAMLDQWALELGLLPLAAR